MVGARTVTHLQLSSEEQLRSRTHAHTHARSRILLSPPPCLLLHTTRSTIQPVSKSQVGSPGAQRAYATRPRFFLVKHVFRKISGPPSRSKTQQERSRLQQSCAELQTGQRPQTERPNRLSRLARSRRTYPKDFQLLEDCRGNRVRTHQRRHQR